MPLHTLIKLTPRAYGTVEERYKAGIDAVSTWRGKGSVAKHEDPPPEAEIAAKADAKAASDGKSESDSKAASDGTSGNDSKEAASDGKNGDTNGELPAVGPTRKESWIPEGVTEAVKAAFTKDEGERP